MDDFQHRLLVALERLAGRGDAVGSLEVGEVLERMGEQVGELIVVLREIRDRLPPVQP